MGSQPCPQPGDGTSRLSALLDRPDPGRQIENAPNRMNNVDMVLAGMRLYPQQILLDSGTTCPQFAWKQFMKQ